MNKKIFAILSILAVLMIGCAYASDSTDSLNNNTITISGMNFTIPDGFTEDVEGAIVNETGSDEGYNYVTESKTFECNDDFIIISVSIYDIPRINIFSKILNTYRFLIKIDFSITHRTIPNEK